MALRIRRGGEKRKSQFERASDGSMTLMDHLRELRSRLFKASLGLVLGLIVGVAFAQPILNFITEPYCDYIRDGMIEAGQDVTNFKCKFNVVSPLDVFMLNLRVRDLDGLLEQLNALGIEITTKDEWDTPETGRFARIHDPEGNPIELWEPPAA